MRVDRGAWLWRSVDLLVAIGWNICGYSGIGSIIMLIEGQLCRQYERVWRHDTEDIEIYLPVGDIMIVDVT